MDMLMNDSQLDALHIGYPKRRITDSKATGCILL
jgi:hypothetical protein